MQKFQDSNCKETFFVKQSECEKIELVFSTVTLLIFRIPFEADAHLSKNLAIKFIEDYKHTNGNDVLVVISRSVSEKTQGEYSLV